jgi:vancomycin resistance protein YoaR
MKSAGARWVAFFFMLFAAGIAGGLAYAAVPVNHVAKGVTVGGVEIGGLTKEEAVREINAVFERLAIQYVIKNGGLATLMPGESFAKLDVVRTVDAAMNVGAEDGLIRSAADRLVAVSVGRRIRPTVEIDDTAFRSALDAAFAGSIDPSQDAALNIDLKGSAPVITITADTAGQRMDYASALVATRKRLQSFSPAGIEVTIHSGEARIRVTDIEPFLPAIERALSRVPLTIAASKESWTISKALISDWLMMTAEDGPIRPAIDRSKAAEFIESRSAKYAVSPVDAVFVMEGAKVKTFTPAKDGSRPDVDATIDAIEKALFEDAEPTATIALAMIIDPAKISTESSNPYGIKEIVGIGESNFAGSPVNRRHNIAVGAAAVHGTLIAPGEEFSMLKTLGTIDGTTGYREELVIKGNKTTPEFGGGLCQIGSTAFRGALASGLPITARQNHSYRVPYYERDGNGDYIGPGKDATIYDPAPDFRFLNDSKHHVLIQTAIDGNKLSFIFWGVSDGRKSEQTDARVYNVVPPPPKKVTKTIDLAPGVERCTEKAHAGSDASFIYTVTAADGTKKETEFKSRYRPWQEVCLLGVTQAELDAAKAAGEVDAEGVVVPQTADAAGATGN